MAAPLNQQPQNNSTLVNPNTPEKKPRGTGFTNLQTLLNANRGAGNRMAGAVSNVATQAGQQAQQQLGSQTSEFNKQVAENVDKAKGAIAGASNVLNPVAQPVQQPVTPPAQQPIVPPEEEGGLKKKLPPGFFNGDGIKRPPNLMPILKPMPMPQPRDRRIAMEAKEAFIDAQPTPQQTQIVEPTEQQIDEAAKLFAEQGQYAGPTSVQNQQQLISQSQQAERLGQALLDENARQSLLGNVYGRGRYGRGFASLDNLLAQKEGSDQFRQAAAQTRGLTERTARDLTGAEMLAQQKQNEVNDLRSKFIESTDKGLSDIITKADEDAKQRQQAVNTLNTFLSRGASGNLQGNIDDLEYGGKKGIAGIKDLFNNLDKYGVDLSDELMDVNEIAGSNLPNVKGVGTPEEQDNFGKIFGGKMFIDPSQQGLNIFQALQQRIGQGNTNVQGKLSESDANRAAALARFMDTAKVNRTRQENLDTIKNLSKTNQDAFQGEQKGFFKDAENTRTGAIRSDTQKLQDVQRALSILGNRDFNQGIPENATSDQITQARMGGTFNFLNSKEVQDAMRLAGYGGERGWNMNDVLWSENALRDSMNALTKRIGENKQAISQGTTSLAQELAKLGIKV